MSKKVFALLLAIVIVSSALIFCPTIYAGEKREKVCSYNAEELDLLKGIGGINDIGGVATNDSGEIIMTFCHRAEGEKYCKGRLIFWSKKTGVGEVFTGGKDFRVGGFNNDGVIAGTVTWDPWDPWGGEPVIWKAPYSSPDSMVYILRDDEYGSIASINDRGQVVGNVYKREDKTYSYHTFIWKEGEELSLIQCTGRPAEIYLTKINARGLAIGSYCYPYSSYGEFCNGLILDLSNGCNILKEFPCFYLQGLNERGEAIGHYNRLRFTVGKEMYRYYSRQSGEIILRNPYFANGWTAAISCLNNRGEMIGKILDQEGRRALLYVRWPSYKDEPEDIEKMINPANRYQIARIEAFNNEGEIVIISTDPGNPFGKEKVVLLKPKFDKVDNWNLEQHEHDGHFGRLERDGHFAHH